MSQEPEEFEEEAEHVESDEPLNIASLAAEPPPVPTESASTEVEAPPAEPIHISEELQAAKWYTISFLIVTGLFSIGGLVGMIWITIWLMGWAMK